jgi:hypothetical protein
MELNDVMRDCLIHVNNKYPKRGYVAQVMEAIKMYDNLTGIPIEMENDEEKITFYNKAVNFLVDCVLFNLIEDGFVQIAGIEDGELVFQATVEF